MATFHDTSSLRSCSSVGFGQQQNGSDHTTGRFRHHPYSWTSAKVFIASSSFAFLEHPQQQQQRRFAPCSVDDEAVVVLASDLLQPSTPCQFDRSNSLHSCGLSVDSHTESPPSTPPAGSLSPVLAAVHGCAPAFYGIQPSPFRSGCAVPSCTTPAVAAVSVEDAMRPNSRTKRQDGAVHPPSRSAPAAFTAARAANGDGRAPSTPFKYALVQFKFHSEYFVAPFRVGSGDAVVTVDEAGVTRIGLVRQIVSDPAEIAQGNGAVPQPTKALVRHARDHDRFQKNRLIASEAADLSNVAQHVCSAFGEAFVCVRDLEWCQDARCATVFVAIARDNSSVPVLSHECVSNAVVEALRYRQPVADVGVRLIECHSQW